MSLAPAEGTSTTVDLFELSASIIEEAQASISLEGSETEDFVAKKHCLDYWGCLYALHASRGDWHAAACVMDAFGKATATSNSVSLASQTVLFHKAASKVMDECCLSAHAGHHAISLVDEVRQKGLPSLTEENLERRAMRALALRTFSMDEFAPKSVGTILKATSLDTIDSLATLGYYHQAIVVAAGASSR